MSSLLSAGVLVFAYAIGGWAIGGTFAPRLRRSALAHHALALAFGVALLTPPLVLVATAGFFRTSWLGALGWIGTAIISTAWWRYRPKQAARFDAMELAVLFAAVVFFGIAVSGRDETLGAGRDQQVYAEFAVALSERGTFALKYAPLDNADRALLRHSYIAETCNAAAFRTVRSQHVESPFVVPGGDDDCDGVDHPIGLVFPSGWPVWLALAHATFGMEGLYAANAAIFALGGLIFFVVVRYVSDSVIAMAATLLLFALPSSLWISGITLSEPLAMTLLLSVPLIAAGGLRWRWSMAVILLAAMLVRIDAAIAVPAVIAAAMLTGLSTPTRDSASRRFIVAQAFALAVAYLVYALLFPRYFESTIQYNALVAAVSLALTILAFVLGPADAPRVSRVVSARASRLAAIAVLGILFVYAAAIRPTREPFSIIQQGLSLDGTRDFREESVRNLAVYLSWPLVMAAVLGLCWSLWQRWSSRSGLLRPLLLVFGIGPALLYLWFPLVTPDHPWAFRRFVPIVVPYALVFAAVFLYACTRRIGRIGSAIGAFALVLPYPLLTGEYPPGRLLMRENQGLTRQIAAIAKELPDGLVLADSEAQEIGTALFVAYGKPVAVARENLHVSGDPEQITKWIEEKAKIGHPAWVLHGTGLWRTGVKLSHEHEWWVTRQMLVPTFRPPATATETRNTQIFLTRIDGLDPTFASRMFGGERIWGMHEAGFFGAEVAAFGMFRYTNGDAWIDVPADALRKAEALKVDVFTYAKEGARRWLRVIIDGRLAWTGSVGAGVATLRIPLPKPVTANIARIELLSEKADPADMGVDDPRTGLSIGLIGLRPLRAGEPALSEVGIEGFRSELALIGVPPGSLRVPANGDKSFILDVRNAGTAYWESSRELGSDAGSVQIALRWRKHNEPEAIVGDNRWPLIVSMLAGDRTRIKVPLRPIGLDGKALPFGEYDVSVGMVREAAGPFADNKDTRLTIPVVVSP